MYGAAAATALHHFRFCFSRVAQVPQAGLSKQRSTNSVDNLNKKTLLAGVVVILAAIGVIVGVMVTRQADGTPASESSGISSSGSGSGITDTSSDGSTTTSSGGTSKEVRKTNSTSTVTSDPTSGTNLVG